MKSILIKRARVINPAENEDFIGDIFVENGRIAYKGERFGGSADIVIDAENLIAAPGLVDMHVHLRDPGFTDKEDIISAGKAAAAGGVTSLLAMPNTSPAADNVETIKYILEKGELSNARCYTAACITKNLAGEELTDIAALVEAGAIALSDDGRPVLEGRHLLEAIEAAEGNRVLLCAHCEDLSLVKAGIMHEGDISRKLGVKGISREAENVGTMREISAAAKAGGRIHICHVSTKEAADMIRKAKASGIKVTAETAPHYMLLTDKELLKRDADYRMNPPLREEADRLAIIEAVCDGTIDAIATDHAPHTPAEKGDFLTAPNGAIGMETSLAATITALDGRLSLMEITEKMSMNPARLLGIPAGTLNVGENADIALVNSSERWMVGADKLHGKSRNTPFKGMELTGRVKYTVCRGKLVYKACT